MKKIKKLLITSIIFLFGILVTYASVAIFFKSGKNWDANVPTTETANDIWTITGSIDIEAPGTPDYIDNKLRGAIFNYKIKSDLFGNFNVLNNTPLKFYGTTTYISSMSPLPDCGDSLEIYEFKDGSKIEGSHWGILEIDKTKSYFCSNQKVHIVFKSQHIASKVIGNASGSLNHDVFGKQQININGVAKVGGDTGSGILSRGDQSSLTLEINNKQRNEFKTNIEKNIAEIYLTNANKVIYDNINNLISSLNNTNDEIDKFYLYDYKGKTNPLSVKYGTEDYINKGKILKIGNNGNLITHVHGKNTIIVKSGNIYINSNIDNTDDTKDLLIIIAKRDKDTNNGGNIYINPDVTNIDAILIADGSLLSYNGNIQGAGYAREIIRKQLLIFGSLMTSNSIGTEKIPYGADYYQKNGLGGLISNNKMTDSIFDLGNLRTFTLKYGVNTYTDCNDESKLVPIKYVSGTRVEFTKAWSGHKKCYIDDSVINGLRSSNKTNPLIIEYNQNITKIKPYIIKS